jgi:CheY-like chemotaxis protein
MAPRVLVVDDNAINRQVADAMLTRMGCAVALASSGPEALARMRETRFGLVLMDIQMPEMNGYEVAVAWRREERGGARMPIVALTADALERTRQECAEVGMDGFLTKPLRMGELAAAVRAWAAPFDA